MRKFCLAEIKCSKPFLVGLLGDQYGWVLPEERMQAAACEAEFEQLAAVSNVTDHIIDFITAR